MKNNTAKSKGQMNLNPSAATKIYELPTAAEWSEKSNLKIKLFLYVQSQTYYSNYLLKRNHRVFNIHHFIAQTNK